MRATSAALLDAAQAAVMPTLFAMSLLQQLSIPMLTPMHTLPRWLAGAGVVVWLGLSLALARVSSPRRRWVLALGGSAAAAAVAAALALGRGGWMADTLGWSMVAAVLAGLGGLVATWRTKPTRIAPRRIALPRPQSMAGLVIAIGFGLCATLFVTGFGYSLSAPDAGRGTGMLLMLISFFLLLPAATLANWFPRAARLGWVIGAISALAVVLWIDTPSPPGLFVIAAVLGYALGAPIPDVDADAATALDAED